MNLCFVYDSYLKGTAKIPFICGSLHLVQNGMSIVSHLLVIPLAWKICRLVSIS